MTKQVTVTRDGVGNPEELDYVIRITPQDLQASSEGAAEFSSSLYLGGTG